MNTSLGCILLSRSIVHSEIFKKPPLYLKVWIYLLTLAQHKEYKSMKRGQLRISIPDIIEACSWKVGARTERPSKDQIFQILEWLRKPDEGGHESNAKATMISTAKATHGMLINIDNYAFYQDFNNYESNGESNGEKATKPPRKQRQPDNINKNVKNDKNDKNVTNKIYYTELVSLLPKEYETMLEIHGESKTKEIIELLHNYKLSSGKTYKSDYGTINSWVVKRWEEDHEKLQKKPYEKPGRRDERFTTKSRTVHGPKQSGWINKPDELPLPDLP